MTRKQKPCNTVHKKLRAHSRTSFLGNANCAKRGEWGVWLQEVEHHANHKTWSKIARSQFLSACSLSMSAYQVTEPEPHCAHNCYVRTHCISSMVERQNRLHKRLRAGIMAYGLDLECCVHLTVCAGDRVLCAEPLCSANAWQGTRLMPAQVGPA